MSLPGVPWQRKMSFSNTVVLGNSLSQRWDAREVAFTGFKDHAVLVALDGGQNVFVQQAFVGGVRFERTVERVPQVDEGVHATGFGMFEDSVERPNVSVDIGEDG